MTEAATRSAAPDPALVARFKAALDRLSEALSAEMEAVAALIRDRMASRHAPRIPEVTAHLIEAVRLAETLAAQYQLTDGFYRLRECDAPGCPTGGACRPLLWPWPSRWACWRGRPC